MVWKLKLIQQKENAIIHGLVLMDNHFHLIISTPNANISKVMYWFMKTVTLDIQKKSKRINKIFGGRYKACLITTKKYLFNATRYIYQNPLRAEICNKAEDYPYSTLHTITANFKLPFHLEPNCDMDLETINQLYTETENEVVKKALRKTKFSLQKDRVTRKELL